MLQDVTDFRLDLDRTLVCIVPIELCVLDVLLPGDDALIMRQGDWQVCSLTFSNLSTQSCAHRAVTSCYRAVTSCYRAVTSCCLGAANVAC